MNIKSLLITSCAILLGAAAANAADAIVYDEPAPIVVAAPAFSWAGAYIGGQVGYGWGRSDFSGHGAEEFHDQGHSLRFKPDGFLGGLYAGFNFDMGNNFILGIDGDVTYNDLESGLWGPDLEGDESSGINNKLRWSGVVRARLGVSMDRWMPYLAGGVAFGDVKNTAWETDGGNIYSASQSKTLTGWTAGAGVDYAATDNVIVRLEYRYTDYGSKNFDADTEHIGFETRNKFKMHDIRLGVAYKF